MPARSLGASLAAIFFATSVISHAASPRTPSLYGIALGDQLSSIMRSCAVQRRIERGAATCFNEDSSEPFSKAADGKMTLAFVLFADGQTPRIAKGPASMAVLTSDGLIQFVSFSTKGQTVQDEAYRQLVEKFGPPATNSKRALQNRFGASFESIEATWRIGENQVTFSGISLDIDTGSIDIISPVGSEMLRERSRSRRNSEPRL